MELTENELFAINQYIGSWYTDINCLMDSGIDSELAYPTYSKPVFFNVDYEMDNLLECIEYVYSAMIKMTMNGIPLEQTLFRGTNTDEIEKINKLGITNKFLSTTIDPNQATDIFANTKSGNPATLVINPSNIPYINVRLVNQDHIRSHEKEFILAPFAKVDSLSFVNYDNTTSIYSCNITKGDFTYLSGSETEYLRTRINNGLRCAKRACDSAIIAYKDCIEINSLLKTGCVEHTSQKLAEYLEQSKRKYRDNIDIYNEWKQLIRKYFKSKFWKIEHDLGFNQIHNIDEMSPNNHEISFDEISENNYETNSETKEILPIDGVFKV